MPQRRTVFISHAHADNTICDRYSDALSALGVDVWYDRTNLEAGQRLSEEIERELQARTAFVVMLSVTSVDSMWVQAEIDAYRTLKAKDRSRLILPVRLDGCAIPPLLTGYKYVDAWALGFDRALVEIARALGVASLATSSNVSDGTATSSSRRDHPGRDDGHQPEATSAEQPETSTNEARAEPSAPSADEFAWYVRDAQFARLTHERLDFFTDRLGEAFPGRRGLHIFSGRDAFDRLTRFLHAPLAHPQFNDNHPPLWWWRGIGCMPIERFQVLDAGRLQCLIDTDEILVDTVAVYRSLQREYQSFVYLLARPESPTGIQPATAADIEQAVAHHGYASEAVARWRDRYISQEELVDGFAEIDGQVVQVDGAERRIRYLTPYNVFITSQTSVLNSPARDRDTRDLCARLLAGTASLQDAVAFVEGLHLPERIADYYYLND